VEAEGNIHSDEGRAMIADLQSFCDRLKVVGTYTL
jgi:prephenate dehydratase